MIDVTWGLFVNDPDKWKDSGIEHGDFISSTKITGDLDSQDKIHQALAAPNGTELIVCRKDERLRVVLGIGIIERESRKSP